MDSFPTRRSGGWEGEQPHFEKPAGDFLGESQVQLEKGWDCPEKSLG